VHQRARQFFFLVAIIGLWSAAASAQSLEVSVTPLGSAAKERPLPVGATPQLSIVVRNASKRAVGPITIVVRPEGVSAVSATGWRLDGGALRADIVRVRPGERVERTVRFKVERAALTPASSRIRVEARASGTAAAADTTFTIADCVGAYREKLAGLRGGLLRAVRDSTEQLRRPDATLPAARLFPATGQRTGELAAAERLAAGIASQRGGDPDITNEWFRFLIERWISEVNSYASQPANPGLCANNYYQIAGYRQGLLPISSRVETIHKAADQAAIAARQAARAESGEALLAVARRVLDDPVPGARPAGSEPTDESALAVLVTAHRSAPQTKRPPDLARAISLIETAAWLAEADRRGQALMRSIEAVLSFISDSHKESCVCAF
jgi:hypothetical protein